MNLPWPFLCYLLIIAGGFVLGLGKFKGNNVFRPIILLLGITLISETVSIILSYSIRTNYPPYHILNPLQSILWGIFVLNFYKGKRARLTICLIIGLMVLLSIMNTAFLQGFRQFPDNILRIQSVVLMLAGFVLFIRKLDEPSHVNIIRDPVFITSVALIWFNLLSFTIIHFHHFLQSDLLSPTTFRIVNYVSNYVYYIMLLIAVVISSQTLKRHEP